MNVDQLIEKIQQEQNNLQQEEQSSEGLAKLQEVAAQYQGEYELVWSEDILEQIKNRPKKSFHKTNTPIDRFVEGFREQQLITLSASSGHGKTQFGLFLIEQMEQLNPVMIPIEQSNEEIIEQRQANGYSIPRFLSPKNLAAQVTVDWVEHRIIEGIAKYDTKLVLIDHLGYIDDTEEGKLSRENLAYRIEKVMKGLKNVAKRWNVIIILVCHISQHDESQPPSTKDLKNSSSILQESDIVLMLWRENEVKNKTREYYDTALLSVQKNRFNGKNGNMGFVFNRDNGSYAENSEVARSLDEVAETEDVHNQDII